LKILIAAGFYYPSQQGGPCNSLYWLAKSLGENGVAVTVVAMDTGIKDPAIVFNTWITTHYGKVIYITTPSVNRPLKYIKTTIAQLKEADIVHLNSVFAPSSFIIGLVALLKGKKILWSPRGEFDPQALRFKKPLKKIMLALLRPFKKHIRFHTTSTQETAHTQSLMQTNLPVLQLPNYMDLPPYQPVTKQPYLLYIGRIHPIKALEALIEACTLSEAFLKGPYQLFITGDSNNEYGDLLKRKVKAYQLEKKVLFIEHVADVAKKNKLFAEAAFTILPSHSENFGNVVVESLANGTPVIASTGTPWQELETTKAGFWVKNDPASLAIALTAVTGMKEDELNTYASNALQLAKNNYDMEANISKWIDGYKSLLNTHAAL
jgi:glycosyltransferase involved in cell wall biosynthesis